MRWRPAAPWVWAATAAFVVAGWIEVVRGRWLHDEGLLTYHFAALAWSEPTATLLLQKSRPPISALFAPFAALGFDAFALAHVLLAAAAIPALAAIARRLEHRWPSLPAVVLASSPLYFGAAVAGVSNSDGVALAVIATWLWFVRGRVRWGCALLGALPWVRAELAPLSALLLLVALREHRWRALQGALAFPLGYALVGAIVHADLLWWAHFPPALPEPMADNPYWAHHDGRIDTATIVASLVALTPACVLAVPITRARMPAVQWAWLCFAALELGVLLALPRWRVFNFDLSPRYLLPVLPALALGIGWRAQALGETDSRAARLLEVGLLAGATVAAHAATVAGAPPAGLVAVAVCAAVIALARAGALGPARALLLALLVVAPWGFGDGVRLRRDREAPELAEILARLREDPGLHERPIYTNVPLLAAAVQREPLPLGRVHYLVQADQLHELVALSNPDNGQRQRLLAALQRDFYGTPVFPDALAPEQLPDDAVLVLVDDARLSLVMPPERWDDALVVRSGSARLRIAELRSRGRR
ncbi:MAG: hypothetical protein K1X88_13180 [Nannocystaceae bacterium]|nr:hypothetical protein [Nannocystaceae bacterium]